MGLQIKSNGCIILNREKLSSSQLFKMVRLTPVGVVTHQSIKNFTQYLLVQFVHVLLNNTENKHPGKNGKKGGNRPFCTG